MNYGFAHQGKVYGPGGVLPLTPDQTAEHNRALEAAELADLRTGPERVFLYVRMPKAAGPCCKVALRQSGHHCPICQNPVSQDRYDRTCDITTWLGTPVGTHVVIGRQYRTPAFWGWGSTRRSVSCRIFGRRYYGTYYESAGNYCRLRRAKGQA